VEIESLLTSQITRVLSSWPPSEARYFSSKEKERLWMKTLWSLRRWICWRVSKSQMMISAYIFNRIKNLPLSECSSPS
jgi:hypothetical protein